MLENTGVCLVCLSLLEVGKEVSTRTFADDCKWFALVYGTLLNQKVYISIVGRQSLARHAHFLPSPLPFLRLFRGAAKTDRIARGAEKPTHGFSRTFPIRRNIRTNSPAFIPVSNVIAHKPWYGKETLHFGE